MNLYDFCEHKYLQGNRENFNGIAAKPANIAGMINCFYSVFCTFFTDRKAFPDAEKLLMMPVSTGGMFNKENMVDLIALVFDVVTERNHNPELWGKHEEITTEITHTFNVLFHGKMAEVYSDGIGAIDKMNNNYQEAKSILEEELKPPFQNLY
ncbi:MULTISPECIES: hypothetical protein [Citrobacter]|uniref:Uncharacterized protein n=1 Tax=Citrobacter telavivensis TaxID=2653932 RepID=A0A6L5E5Q7_9ENTR|nr:MULTISPECIES: hypothetical protein [Citrobacter]MPQ50822.1 hypothetical protein [Citrobacter telavivensis]QFS72204.1 hypothetical protein GBC03_19325 [Citrobacter telavivensis]CAI9390351.1 hypothetical protein CITSP_03526 [Citrobacter sp. T1.2D-1]